MQIKPKENLLLIKKHKNSKLSVDIAIVENDSDKSLITGEVLHSGKNSDIELGTTVIFGKYAVYKLTLKGEDFFFLDEADVIATCDYSE